MGNITATDEDVVNAAKQAGCHEFIASLSEGYETAAGNAGNKLSGGQKQRIMKLLPEMPGINFPAAKSSGLP